LAAGTESGQTARRIADAVRSLDRIVGDVLAFARETHPRKASLDARDILRRAVEAQRPVIERAGILVRVQAPQGLAILADRELLHQALVNLVRNAVEAMSGGGVLALAARRQGPTAVLTVRDTGPGIAQEHIERIFNPFFTTRNTGTGLGLAIVHRIVDAHGGAIAVSNDGGAVFEITLWQHERPGPEAPEPRRTTTARTRPARGVDTQPQRIAVASGSGSVA
jgi:signal transduction histidine kinase